MCATLGPVAVPLAPRVVVLCRSHDVHAFYAAHDLCLGFLLQVNGFRLNPTALNCKMVMLAGKVCVEPFRGAAGSTFVARLALQARVAGVKHALMPLGKVWCYVR